MQKILFVIILLLLVTIITAHSDELAGFKPELIDTSVNPGDDFYSYASGLWLKNTNKPDGVGRFGYYNLADKIIEQDLFDILNGTVQFDSENHLANLITNIYQSGMDTITINSIGTTPISNELALIDAIKTNSDLQQTLTKFILIGINPFFGQYRPKPWQIIDTNYACFTQTRFGLSNSSDYFNDSDNPDSKLGQYKIFIINLLKTVLSDTTDFDSYANLVISIESKLSSKMMNQNELRNFDKTYNIYKIKKLKSLIPQFDWELFFSDIGMTGTNKVVIGQPKYFKEIGKVFKSYDIESLKRYLKYFLIYRTSSILNSELAQLFWDFKINVCGWQEVTRSISIFDIVNRVMPDALGALFLEAYFPSTKKDKISAMITDLKDAFRNRIQKNEFIGDSSKDKIINKLDNMKFLVGGPEKYVDFDDLIFEENGFIRNLFAIREFSTRKYISTMGTAKDYSAWSVNPHSTNAWYGPSRNTITLPAGNIIEFWSDNDNAWNYGTLGATIAHEMTHGFDAEGRKYDENGSAFGFWEKMKGWWDDSDNHFEDCAERLEEKYNKFIVLDYRCH